MTIYGYDSVDNQTSVTDALGHTTTSTYDALNRRVSVKDALNNTTSYQYDANGNRTKVTDARNNATSYAYDALNRLTSVTDALSGVVTYNYDANGNRTSLKDANNHATTYAYDNLNRLIGTTDPLGRVSSTDYDSVGNVVASHDPNSHTTTFVYDALRRLTQQTNATSNTSASAYDAVGNRISRTDGNGQVTKFAYDALRRLTDVIDPLRHTWHFTYDLAGNRLTLQDPNLHTTTYTYDAMNHLVSTTDPLGQVLSYSYDAFGRKASQTDRKGQTTTYAYDVANRLTTVVYVSFSVQLTYDAVGNRLQMLDPSGTTSYRYDALNRPTSLTYNSGDVVGLAYDAASNRTSIVYPGGGQVQYSYDAADQLSTITDWSGQTMSYAYDPAGNLTNVSRPNGATSAYTYDPDNRVVSIMHSSPAAGPLAAFQYTYDGAGNRTSITSLAGTDNFLYDADGRLTQASYGSGQPSIVKYQYDPAGNRTFLTETGTTGDQVTSYTYDAADRVTSVAGTTGTQSYTWDANGSLLSDGTRTYSWDSANRLTATTIGSDTFTNTYNGDGWRLAQTAHGATTTYRYLPIGVLPQVLTEQQGGQTVRYGYGIGTAWRDDPAAGRAYYHTDGLGSVATLTNASGQPVVSYVYDAFGKTRLQTGSATNDLRFTGQQLDETQLYFMRARYYDPALGRFISRDTFAGDSEDPASLHPYIYAASNPLNLVDPSGESFEEWKNNTLDFWKEVGVQAKATYQIAAGTITGDATAKLALSYTLDDIRSGAALQRLPDAAKRTAEAIDLPQGMRETANDAFEAANEYDKQGQGAYAWTLRGLGAVAYTGSAAVDALADIYSGGAYGDTKDMLKGTEMFSGLLTGKRTRQEATEFALEYGANKVLDKVGDAASKKLLSKYFIGPCEYSTAACRDIRQQFIEHSVNLAAMGKFFSGLVGNHPWLKTGLDHTAGWLSGADNYFSGGGGGGGGGGSWGGPPSQGK
ncbi:MAG: RHS repeat-associated core domain-containing protein [Anaerolineae bacterium]